METMTIYFILITSISLPLIQVLLSMNYLKVFAFEYLTNSPRSWNPNQDRLVLISSIVFGSFSMYLAKEIWSGKTEDSWLLTSIYFLLIVLLFFLTAVCIIKIQKDKLSKQKAVKLDKEIEVVDEREFKIDFDKVELQEIFQRLVDNLLIEILIDDSDKINDQDLFVKILSEGFIPEKPIFRLNLDNIQTKLFLTKLQNNESKTKRNLKFTQEKFSKIFQNKNGIIKASSLSTSTSKSTSEPKDANLIESIFSLKI